MNSRRSLLAGGVAVATQGLWMVAPRAADSYPNKAVTIVVPQAPGGANDVVGRALAEQLTTTLGVPVIVDNRQGAGGNVGTIYVARQPKDGYTLLLNAQSVQTINPALYRKPGFDPVKDFDPIMVICVSEYMLAVNPALPVRNVRELVALAKAQPGKLNFASAGNGTVNHLLGEMMKLATGVDIVHVPYRGASAAAVDVIGGQAQMTFGSIAGLLPFVKAGQLRALGVCSEKRTPLAPDLPTLNESIPGLHATAWYGLFAPAGTPKAIVDQLHGHITKLLSATDMKEKLVGLGVEAAPSTPEQLAALVRQDLVRWSKIVKDSGAQVD